MSFYQLILLTIKELVFLLAENIRFPQGEARKFFFFLSVISFDSVWMKETTAANYGISLHPLWETNDHFYL